MSDDVAALRRETLAAIATADLPALEALRVAVLGRQGRLTLLVRDIARLSPQERRSQGAALNRFKDEIIAAIAERRRGLQAVALESDLARERADVTLPPRPTPSGSIHPISRALEEIVAIFGAMGFTAIEGPEIEDDWRNFGALNIPEHHPARQDMDTFYL
ncbi:MAG: phenylalanine--tRNA ligase subunit alpha, partial [Acetobacteraceae bacterium]